MAKAARQFGLCIVFLLVMALPSFAQQISYESAAVGRIVGETPAEMTAQFNSQDFSLGQATYYSFGSGDSVALANSREIESVLSKKFPGEAESDVAAGLVHWWNWGDVKKSVDEWGKKVWVVGSNAVFELSYASPTTFRSRASATYSLTAAGRGLEGASGPTQAGSPRRYIFPKGNLLFTGSRLIVADGDPANGRFFINQLSPPLTASADSLTDYYAAPPGSDRVGEQMLFDYAAGSAYMVGRDATVRRVDIR